MPHMNQGYQQQRSTISLAWIGLVAILSVAALGLAGWQQTAAAPRSSSDLADALPDLVVSEVISAQSIGGCPTSPAGVLITIRNDGDVAASDFDTLLMGGATSCLPWRLSMLLPGETHTFFCPAGIGGTSEYTAIVDSADQVLESDESNNEWVGNVTVITLPTCTPSPTPTATATPTSTPTDTLTPTVIPTGWLGPQTIQGRVRQASDLLPIAGAFVGGEVYGVQGGYRPLPVATSATDGSYIINTGFALYDTDTITIQASATGYTDNHATASGLEIHAGATVDIALQPILPTPTPTPTSDTFLHITVYLQGRPAAPDPSWQVPLHISLDSATEGLVSHTTTCNASGAVQLPIKPGTYDIQIRGDNTLTNSREGLFFGQGLNLVHMGTLRAGDMNEDAIIDILDFSYFRTRFGTMDVQADLNNSGWVDIADFSLFRANFGTRGPIQLASEE